MRKATFIMCIACIIFSIISVVVVDSIYAESLSWGSTGEEVRLVQQKLKQWGYYKGSVDGVYGEETYRAVLNFQIKNGLAVDGKVGIQTKNALGITRGMATVKYDETVKRTQQKLRQWGYYYGGVDGIYGPQTWQAVVDFQRKNGLNTDGIIGSDTKRALGIQGLESKTAYSPSSGGVSRNKDVNLLAAAIHGEARGEPYAGQVAVGAVILNRVKHPSFPNTIAGVIYQPLAFTAVADGQMYLSPNDTSYKAARDALNGWDPTGGAIYYWNPATATSKWIWSRQATVVIGKHWFAHE